MDKTEMAREIAKGLLKIAADLCLLAETLQDGCKTDVAAPVKEEKTAEPVESVSLETVRGVLADKSRNGHTAEVREIIRSFGADKLSGIDPKDYQEVLKKAEVL